MLASSSDVVETDVINQVTSPMLAALQLASDAFSSFGRTKVTAATETTGSADRQDAMMQYRFSFNYVFGPESEQEDVFELVGKRMCVECQHMKHHRH